MSNPSSWGWGPGWPKCQTSKIVTLRRNDGLVLPVRQEIVQLIAYLTDATEQRGYDLRPGQCWGFSCRAIRGSNQPSEHSWGLAVDINAPANPMLYGKPGWAALHQSGRTDMPEWMPPLWEAHMFRWGGNYRSRQDAMHYEFMGTPADAARITKNIAGGTAPAQAYGLPLVLHKGTPSDPYTRGDTAKSAQEMLAKWNAKYHVVHDTLDIDSVYGKDTAKFVVAFKHWVREFQLSFKQPVWPNEDTTCGPVTYGALQFWTA